MQRDAISLQPSRASVERWAGVSVRRRILGFVRTLREHGVDVSVAETLDAVAAVGVAGVEREVLRESLAATLVKDERERETFDPLFEAAFPLRGATAREARGRSRARGRADTAAGAGAGDSTTGRARGQGGGRPPGPPPEASASSGRTTTARSERESPAARSGDPDPTLEPRGPGSHSGASEQARDDRRWAAGAEMRRRAAGQADAVPGTSQRGSHRGERQRALLRRPFGEFTAPDVAEARQLVTALGRRLRGRLLRRERARRRGRIDLRGTLRASIASGGVPLRLRRRARRRGRPDVVALGDLSGSAAAASELCLTLLAAAMPSFRRVDLFAYVDRLCAVSIEGGHVAPEGHLDLYARSDLGRVLADLWERRELLRPTSLLLVVGDARNNRLPARVDLWRAVRERVGRIVWLVPEPRARWNTGDSDLARYAALCDAVFECRDLGSLAIAVRRTFGSRMQKDA